MKHAYLIIANRNSKQLQLLINTIDDSRNDIYLLIDKKSNIIKKYSTLYSDLYVLPSIDIFWGGFSQIQAEINLFRYSTFNNKYCYYHLLSGLDLPLFNQDIIHDFFDNNLNQEFVSYCLLENKKDITYRIKKHFFKDNRNIYVKIFNHFYNSLIKYFPQHKINIKYLDYGSNWVSIDDSLARFIVLNEQKIKEIFNFGFLVDEVFVPTLINSSSIYKNKIYLKHRTKNDNPKELYGNLRYINWWDGNPYTWNINDYDQLYNARSKGHLFSRKFDENIDEQIIKKVINNMIFK